MPDLTNDEMLFKRAVKNGDLQTVQAMMSQKNYLPTSNKFEIALDICINNNDHQMIAYLCDRITTTYSVAYFIEQAAKYSTLEVVKELCSAANIHVNNTRALFCAVERGNIDTVAYLLSRGADVNLKDKQTKKMPLEVAESPRIIKLLLDRGADIYSCYDPDAVIEKLKRLQTNISRDIPLISASQNHIAKLETKIDDLTLQVTTLNQQLNQLLQERKSQDAQQTNSNRLYRFK